MEVLISVFLVVVLIIVSVILVSAIVKRFVSYKSKNSFPSDYNNQSKNLDNVLVTNFKKETEQKETSATKEIVFEKPVAPVSVVTPTAVTATVTELKPKKPRKTNKVKLDVKKELPVENTKQQPAKITASRAKKVKENTEVENKVVSVKPKRSKTDKK